MLSLCVVLCVSESLALPNFSLVVPIQEPKSIVCKKRITFWSTMTETTIIS